MTALAEYLTGILVVRTFSVKQEATSVYAVLNDAQHRAEMVTVRQQAPHLPVAELATVASTAVALGLGGWVVLHDDLTVGTLTAFLLYLIRLGDPVQTLSYLMTTMQSAAAERRLRDLHAAVAPEALVPAGPQPEEVCPSRPGEHLALLLGGELRPERGVVSYAGRDPAEVCPAELRRRIVVLEQQPYLVAVTVLDYLVHPAPLTPRAQVVRLLEDLGTDHLVNRLAGGLDSPVGVGGENLSLGLRQVLVAVRALISPARVIVLDEITAHFDPATERVLVAALDRLFAERTVVVIAHRLDTVASADRIAMVAGGRIAEIGSHTDLLVRGGRYAALWGTWSSEELAGTSGEEFQGIAERAEQQGP